MGHGQFDARLHQLEFWAWQFGVEIHVGDVHGHILCLGSGEDTIPMDLDGVEVGYISACVAIIIKSVSSSCHSGSKGFLLLGSVVTDNSGIGDFLVGRDVLLVTELHGVGSNDVSDASHESSHLIGARGVP